MQLLTEAELSARVIEFTRQALAAGITSQRELARRIYFSQGYLSLVLSGARQPTPALVDALIGVLRIHLADVFTAAELGELTRQHASLLEASAA